MNFMPARRVSLLIASKFVVGLMMVCWSSVVGISVSHASDPRPQLHKSMSYYEVVKLWGAPVESMNMNQSVRISGSTLMLR